MTKNKKLIRILFTAALLMLVCFGMAAQVFNETRGYAEYPTIQTAINNAQGGDVLVISTGTYTGALTITKSLTLRAAGSNVILSGNSVQRILNIQGTTADRISVALKDIKLVNGNAGTSGGAINAQYLALLKITGCTFEYNTCTTSGGAVFAADVDHMYIENSVFANNTATNYYGGGLYVRNSVFEMYNSVVKDNSSNTLGSAMLMINNGIPLQEERSRVENCVFTGNTSGNTSIDIRYQNVYFNHVTVTANDRRMYFLGGSNEEVQIDNSIIYNESLPTSYQAYMNSIPTITYNNLDIKGGASAGFYYSAGGTPVENNVFSADPLFADSNGVLLPGSPCLEAGSISPSRYDILGNKRPQPAGTNPDLGAYESTGETTVTTKGGLWHFDEIINNNYSPDAGPAGNNAMLSGSLYLVEGRKNKAIHIDGSNYSLILDADEIDFGTADFSISAWIKTTENKAVIFDKRGSTGGGIYAMVYYGYLSFQLKEADGSYLNFNAYTGPQLNDNQWHMIAITLDRDNPSGGTLYVDGTVVKTFNPTSLQGSVDNDNHLFIGYDLAGNYHLNGAIDELRLTAGQLSGQEVQDLFTSGLTEPVTFTGKVTNLKDNTPVAGATVSVGKVTATTDAYGAFSLQGSVEGDSAIINIMADGFAPYSQPMVNMSDSEGVWHADMLPVDKTVTYLPTEPTSIATTSGFSVSFPAMPEITEPIVVNVTGYDVSTSEIAAAPGDFTALNKDGEEVVLISQGMIDVTVTGLYSNKEYSLAGYGPFTITIPATGNPAMAPESIELWYYDTESGLWIEEGLAVKQGGVYVGQVNHFTTWNADIEKKDPVMVVGYIVDAFHQPGDLYEVTLDFPGGGYYRNVFIGEEGNIEIINLPREVEMSITVVNLSNDAEVTHTFTTPAVMPIHDEGDFILGTPPPPVNITGSIIDPSATSGDNYRITIEYPYTTEVVNLTDITTFTLNDMRRKEAEITVLNFDTGYKATQTVTPPASGADYTIPTPFTLVETLEAEFTVIDDNVCDEHLHADSLLEIVWGSISSSTDDLLLQVTAWNPYTVMESSASALYSKAQITAGNFNLSGFLTANNLPTGLSTVFYTITVTLKDENDNPSEFEFSFYVC